MLSFCISYKMTSSIPAVNNISDTIIYLQINGSIFFLDDISFTCFMLLPFVFKQGEWSPVSLDFFEKY